MSARHAKQPTVVGNTAKGKRFLKTVYEYTDIHPSDLPEDMQIKIRKGECRLDVHGLYEFLENYSS